MGFSDKLREGLGAEGATVEIKTTQGSVPRGSNLTATVTIVGAGKAAEVEALKLRLVEARRHWTGEGGEAISEDDAQALDDRRHLEPAWDRTTVGESTVAVGHTLEASGRHDVDVSIEVPETCAVTSPGCTHTLFVQADVKGQIDPTGNVKVTVG